MLEKIASYHNLWLKMTVDLNVEPIFRQDIVQDMYVKMHHVLSTGKDISYGEDGVNTFYIWCVLKSMSGQRKRIENFNVTSLDAVVDDNTEYCYLDSLMSEGDDIEKLEAFDKVYDRVMSTLNNVSNHPNYPKYLKDKVPHFMNLFVGYNGTDKSMRKIAEETGIRLGTIHKTLNKVMDIVRAEVGEDVQDYFNKEYHLI